MITRLLTRAKPPAVYPVGPPMVWPADSYGLGVCSEAEALDLPVVSAALDLLTAIVLQMPLGAVTGDTVIEPTPLILRNPSPAPGSTLGDWLTAVILDVSLHGNYLAVLADPGATGWPTALYGVPWGQWSVRSDGQYQIGPDVYSPGDIFHVCTGCRTGEQVGRGLLQTHPRLLASAIAAERFAADYFLGGAAPPTVLTHPDPELTAERAALLKDRFRAATRRREAVVVPTGTVITQVTSDADSAQLSESRRWNSLQLCIAMGVPPALLGLDSPSLTYRNVAEVYSQFVSSTVMGMLLPIEQQLTLQVLARGTEARFDPRPLLRPDIEARVDLAIKSYGAGLMSRAEARSIIDLPPDIGEPDALTPASVPADAPLTLVPEEVGA